MIGSAGKQLNSRGNWGEQARFAKGCDCEGKVRNHKLGK